MGGRIKDAIRHHSSVLRLVNRPMDKAFHGTLLILDHRSPEAKPFFEEAIAELETSGVRSQAQDYILCYCRSYAAMIDGKDESEFRLDAEFLSPVDPLRRLLPLPAPQRFDK